jgi:hypothetical protein
MLPTKACSKSAEADGIGREQRVAASIKTAIDRATAAHRPVWNSACANVTEDRPTFSTRVPTSTVPGQCSSLR